MKVTVKAYAKINLMLDILSTLENGYHDLFMIMQSVGIFDRVTVTKTESEDIEITCSKDNVPTDEKNIVHKIATRFFADTGVKNTGKQHCGDADSQNAPTGGKIVFCCHILVPYLYNFHYYNKKL